MNEQQVQDLIKQVAVMKAMLDDIHKAFNNGGCSSQKLTSQKLNLALIVGRLTGGALIAWLSWLTVFVVNK